VILLGSGIQFLNFDNFFLSESWEKSSRKKLIQMLDKLEIGHKIILLSGDVHYA
jgi:hypothetical protein